VTDRAGNDEDPDVVRAGIRRKHEKPVTIGLVIQRRSHDYLAIDEGDFNLASMAELVEDPLFDVGGVARRRSHRRPDVELHLRGAKILGVAFDEVAIRVPDDHLVPARRRIATQVVGIGHERRLKVGDLQGPLEGARSAVP